MLKDLIKKTVLKLFPELAAGLHLPLLAIVVKIPDPPTGGQVCDEFNPKYAVDCRLLKPDFSIDDGMPLMRDVPVALSGAAPDRGFALLPQPGTIVEIAFAFGMQTHPYIRAVLPHFRKLPKIDDKAMRWQQTTQSWLQVDGVGNWRQETDQNITRNANQKITDTSLVEFSAFAPKIWLGSQGDNFLQIVSDYMQTVNTALTTIATHTHTCPDGVTSPPAQSGNISGSAAEVAAEKARTEAIKK